MNQKETDIQKEKTSVNLFFDEPKEYNTGDGNKFEVYEHGDVFENTINGIHQKIKPFVGLTTKKDGWTEIGVSLLPENGGPLFWGIHDFEEGRKVNYYPYFKKSMGYFKNVKEIRYDTCAHCYYVATGRMSLVDGKFLEKIKPPEEKKPETPVYDIYEKKNKFWNWLFWIFVISIIIWFIFF